jgi:hypothetical protein
LKIKTGLISIAISLLELTPQIKVKPLTNSPDIILTQRIQKKKQKPIAI